MEKQSGVLGKGETRRTEVNAVVIYVIYGEKQHTHTHTRSRERSGLIVKKHDTLFLHFRPCYSPLTLGHTTETISHSVKQPDRRRSLREFVNH